MPTDRGANEACRRPAVRGLALVLLLLGAGWAAAGVPFNPPKDLADIEIDVDANNDRALAHDPFPCEGVPDDPCEDLTFEMTVPGSVDNQSGHRLEGRIGWRPGSRCDCSIRVHVTSPRLTLYTSEYGGAPVAWSGHDWVFSSCSQPNPLTVWIETTECFSAHGIHASMSCGTAYDGDSVVVSAPAIEVYPARDFMAWGGNDPVNISAEVECGAAQAPLYLEVAGRYLLSGYPPRGSGVYTASWDGRSQDTLQPLPPAVYTINGIWAFNQQWCRDSDAITIFRVQISQPGAFPAYACLCDGLSLSALVTPSQALGGTYAWSKVSGPGALSFLPSPNVSAPTVQATSPGTYRVKVQYTRDGAVSEAISGDIEMVHVNVAASSLIYAYTQLPKAVEMTGSYSPFGYTWDSSPGGISGAGYAPTIAMGTRPDAYHLTVRAANLPACRDECDVVIVKADIVQEVQFECWTETTASLNLTTDSYSPGGFSWTSQPAGISGPGLGITFNPNATTPDTYFVRATSVDLPTHYDECIVAVLKADIEQMAVTNCASESAAWLNLTTDSHYWQVNWSSTPAGLVGTGSGSTFTYMPSASTPGLYTVRATEPNSQDCYDECQVAIIKVDSVEWETYSGNTPLDACPNNGGKRVFPGKKDPTDTDALLRRRVQVRAKISPPVEGVEIYFRPFDVDDPFTDSSPLDSNGSAGGDNRVGGWAMIGGWPSVTDSSGEATAVFSLNSRQPGDNFVMLADCSDTRLSSVTQNQVDSSRVP